MPFGQHSFAKAQIGYCTNVHAGTDMTTIRARLDEFAAPIAAKLAEGEKLGVGLWLPFSAASELWPGDGAVEFGKWLSERRLLPFTINGFPFDNFHLPVVKHRVYRPTWADERRLRYTSLLARILVAMNSIQSADDSDSMIGSISTLPIGWPGDDDMAEIQRAGENLRRLAIDLETLEQETGRLVTVAIEPEPGCLLDRCEDVIAFFETQLPEANHRRYLSVCHDICHSAVMFEDQADTLRRYAVAGISVGKVQVSSAIDVRLDALPARDRAAAILQLGRFAEDRYLHQTGCLDVASNFRLVEDLPLWLDSDQSATDKQLRIHFHVPIFLERFGKLQTTRDDIGNCIAAMQASGAPKFTGHWEIETYAWTVMPSELRMQGLGADIERELDWFQQELSAVP